MNKNTALLFICISSMTVSTIMGMDTAPLSILPNDPIRTHNSEGLLNIKRPKDGNTPFHLAIRNYGRQGFSKDENDGLLNMLLQKVPNPFILNHNGKTPLDEAKELQKKGFNDISDAIDTLREFEKLYYEECSEIKKDNTIPKAQHVQTTDIFLKTICVTGVGCFCAWLIHYFVTK